MASIIAECNTSDTFNISHHNNLTCVNQEFRPDHQRLLEILVVICGCLSLLGSLFIIITFISFKQLRAPALRLVLFLSITDFMSTVDYITSIIPSYNTATCEMYPLCYIQSAFGQFAELSRIFWVSCIAFNLWLIAARGMSEAVANRLQKVYHGVSWGVPAVTVIIIFATGIYGPAGSWCWIAVDYSIERFFLLYLWLILAIVFVLLCYIHVGFAVRGSSLAAVVGRLRW